VEIGEGRCHLWKERDTVIQTPDLAVTSVLGISGYLEGFSRDKLVYDEVFKLINVRGPTLSFGALVGNIIFVILSLKFHKKN
jgi:hypothetical protein